MAFASLQAKMLAFFTRDVHPNGSFLSLHSASDSRSGSKRFGAIGAGTDVAEVVVAIDAGGVAIAEADLNGVVAHLRAGLGARLWFDHRQNRRRCHSRRERLARLFFATLVIASSAGTLGAPLRKPVLAH